jgi:hypothetical protein
MGQTVMPNALDRLKVLIDSSTPIVVMETVEETRAVRLVRVACSALNLATFEWTIASGLARSGAMGELTVDHADLYGDIASRGGGRAGAPVAPSHYFDGSLRNGCSKLR